MTDLQKILALDAALVECLSLDAKQTPEINKALSKLRDMVYEVLGKEGLNALPFDYYLKQQKEAVKLLAESDSVFGG